MLVLEDGLVLYHGSYAAIEKIDLDKCAPGRDFGRGFYLTSSYEQAKGFVPLSIKKRLIEGAAMDPDTGFISSYRIEDCRDLNIHTFEEADAEWLHFVASNRRRDLFPELRNRYDSFDVVVGKIANDRTALTLQLYVSGAFGEPGTIDADNIAIATLLPNRLEDQFCFRTPAAIDCLRFERSEPYGV